MIEIRTRRLVSSPRSVLVLSVVLRVRLKSSHLSSKKLGELGFKGVDYDC